MKHEKIFKRKDGTEYKLMIFLISNPMTLEETGYDPVVFIKENGEWVCCDDYGVTFLERMTFTIKQRLKYDNLHALQYVTADEIHETSLELYEKIKPIKR